MLRRSTHAFLEQLIHTIILQVSLYLKQLLYTQSVVTVPQVATSSTGNRAQR